MSQRLPKQLLCTELTTVASASEYTAPANTRTTISACSATNKTATARYVTATITPSGGTARNICYQRVIAAGETFNIPGAIGQSLEAAGKLSVLAEANTAIDLVVSGYETNP